MWRSSPTQSRGLGGHLNAQEGEDKVKLNQESQARHLLAEKGEDQIQRTPEHYGGHLHEEKDKIKSNSPKKCHGGHLHAEGSLAQLCFLFLCSTDDQVRFNCKVFAKHIHLKCDNSSHFLSWFLNYSSQEQNIHPFTFTVSCKLKKLSKTMACIWSFTFTYLK